MRLLATLVLFLGLLLFAEGVLVGLLGHARDAVALGWVSALAAIYIVNDMRERH